MASLKFNVFEGVSSTCMFCTPAAAAAAAANRPLRRLAFEFAVAAQPSSAGPVGASEKMFIGSLGAVSFRRGSGDSPEATGQDVRFPLGVEDNVTQIFFC